MRCLESIADSTDLNLSKLWEMVKDRKAWHAELHGVVKSWTRLSEWTPSQPFFKHKDKNKDTFQTCKDLKVDLPDSETHRGCALSDGGGGDQPGKKRDRDPGKEQPPAPAKKKTHIQGCFSDSVNEKYQQLLSSSEQLGLEWPWDKKLQEEMCAYGWNTIQMLEHVGFRLPLGGSESDVKHKRRPRGTQWNWTVFEKTWLQYTNCVPSRVCGYVLCACVC